MGSYSYYEKNCATNLINLHQQPSFQVQIPVCNINDELSSLPKILMSFVSCLDCGGKKMKYTVLVMLYMVNITLRFLFS